MNDFWAVVASALQQEFSDMNEVGDAVRIMVRLLTAMLLGGLIGYERESSGKSAGLRTHMLVSLGAALFVLAPTMSGMSVGDQSRVLQGIIAGIGFLGAGAIIKSKGAGDVKGLTTAASIWLTAAVGIATGMGREMLALVSTVLALFILGALHRLETRIERKRGEPRRKGMGAVPGRDGRASPDGPHDASDTPDDPR